ncbi:LANO_0D07228g1_1 [Lachancea nothofagi CBS 11611]|uniref:Mitochondrial intermediate peptidase n=1 Tax=Lachancea nothofagi CBS 11611 TaxID=1266666 RepID=A0A1G4JI88_9SACH|nr:LANO_0D07228g1_1 [Lachancea nothofagi CBS 11611]
MILRSVAVSRQTRYTLGRNLRLFASVASVRAKHDLRKVFDNQKYWREINNEVFKRQDSKSKGIIGRITQSATPLETGLFQNPYLKSSQGLRKYSMKTLEDAQLLVEQMRSDRSENGHLAYIQRLDRLSDLLCRVIDLCEFVRASHPDPQFIQAAQLCHEEMFEFMNVLNTDATLYEILKSVLRNRAITAQLSKEEIKVGNILLEDFEKSGIDMAPEVGEQFISLSQQISLIGQDFINNTDFAKSEHVRISCQDLDKSGMNKLLLNQLSRDAHGLKYKVPTHGYVAFSILRSCPNEKIRMKIWTAMHSCPDQQITRLKQLAKLRGYLAYIMGKKSYSEYQLEGKMAKSPAYVRGFVQSLVDATKPLAVQELKLLANLKCTHLNLKLPESDADILNMVRPWDREFYSTLNALQQQRKSLENEQISSYFSVGTVIQGLSNLFQSIYGIKLEPVVATPGETWSPEVRRINVVNEKDGIIGVVYCDLFERAGKTTNPAHFTVCCSRQIYPEEKDLSTIQVGHLNSTNEKFQLPVISLVCSFAQNSATEQDVCLLQLSDVDTLFHEMGHAMHSMLGRTSLQNISGTRCATDFVELPSILMEHFARDPRVLSKIGQHYITNKPVPPELLKLNQTESTYLQHTETFSQAKMAMLDQEVHSSVMLTDTPVDIVKIYHDLETKLGVLADDQSNWCGRFGHLFGYGATYYSYLFDRAIASKIWKHLFAQDPFSRNSGEKFINSVLKWGGSRDPWECIADALDKKDLTKGDEMAMRYIGNTEDI